VSAGARFAEVVSHPNIALAKYWGKKSGDGNVPATPSLSVTLSGLSTKTRVVFDPKLTRDELSIGGCAMTGAPLARATEILDAARKAASCTHFARVESQNDFPTASGLASSASGFSALALAAVRAARLDWDVAKVAELARRTSASAARSFFSGFAELVPEEVGAAAPQNNTWRARVAQVAPKEHLALSVLACVVTEDEKAVSSSDGMRKVAAESPFYDAWVSFAARSFSDIRAALLAKDFEKLGALSEKNALAMHATAQAIGVFYMQPISLAILEEVRRVRARGTLAFATMDAGPHVKVLVTRDSKDAVAAALAAVPGVLRVIASEPGDAARVVAEGDA
jgi:diphosphomevalonate decarboxylase